MNRDPQVIMSAYRRYIMSFKFKHNEQLSKPAKRIARGLIHYRQYIDEYLAAKREVLKAKNVQASHT